MVAYLYVKQLWKSCLMVAAILQGAILSLEKITGASMCRV
jgi:hypothetical protein